ncbi:MAG: ATP-dependent helicase [bacterium]|nr:ATP-dependent helicase [bacterium]
MKKIEPNELQKQAIKQQKGQIMLLAGPGTGKTFTVINRIEKMLEDGVKPSSILCLTFSDAAANEMRQRLIKKMGVIASSVDVYTYHSFCNDVIKEYPTDFEMASNVRLITDTERINIMRECIDEANLEFFVPPSASKYFFTSQFITLVEKLKSKRISKEEYMSCIDTNPELNPQLAILESEIYEIEQKGKTRGLKTRQDAIDKINLNIKKAKELWTLYELYSKKMLEQNVIDFSDMINFVLNKFDDDKAFLKEVSNKYSYFLVDEYQDTNDLQNSIIFNLLDENNEKNIFVVGDDDQIIYGFQGANTDNLENFLTKYPETKVICLRENNRSTQTILDFSYNIVTKDTSRLENNPKFIERNINKKLTAKNENIIKKDKKVKRIQFGETLQELNYIVDEIKTLIDSDDCPTKDGKKALSEIAIITKKREELETFSELLKGKNIPFQIDNGKSIFSIRSSLLIYFYLKALHNRAACSDKLFGLLLAEPFKINLEDYNRIRKTKEYLKANKKEPCDFISIMEQLSDWKDADKINNFLNTFKHLQNYAATNGLRNFIVELINRTGILECFYRLGENRMENLMGIKKMISEANDCEKTISSNSLAGFIEYLDLSIENEIEICIDKAKYVQNAVQLTTYHGSKGREFGHVYLPNLIEKRWESFKGKNEYKLITEPVFEKEEAQNKKDSELLRLLFVGITRAKHALTLSFADMDDGKAQQVTKYLQGIDDENIENIQLPCDEEEFTKEFVRNISRAVFENQKAFKNDLEEKVERISLSPSRLNDYISCPRKFFYLKVLEIDVEEANWDSANFGTIIHELLENAIIEARENGGTYPTKEKMKEKFYSKVEASTFSKPEEKEKFIKQGETIFSEYYPLTFAQIPCERVAEIEYGFNDIEINGFPITGKIDRIEKNEDGTYELYDYKTGTSVAETQIAKGGSKENYFNQLCFYKYAFEKVTGNKVSKVGLIYVKENKTKVKVLDKENMDYISELITETFEKIKNLQFLPNQECKSCGYCEYKQLCKLDVI